MHSELRKIDQEIVTSGTITQAALAMYSGWRERDQEEVLIDVQRGDKTTTQVIDMLNEWASV